MKTFYTPYLPLKLRGLACRYFIVIHRDHKNDEGLHRHERIHCLQQKEYGLPEYLWRYWRDLDFRAEMEYRAFKYGSDYPPERIHALLVSRYGIPSELAREVIGR